MTRWTEAELEAHQQRHGNTVTTKIGQRNSTAPAQSKMRNKKCTIDGIAFDSTIEAAYYLYLENKKKELISQSFYYLRQLPIRLPGGVTYWVDFVTFNGNHPVEYIDVKGRRTQTFINKKKQVEALYPIRIKEIAREDIPKSYLITARQIRDMSS